MYNDEELTVKDIEFLELQRRELKNKLNMLSMNRIKSGKARGAWSDDSGVYKLFFDELKEIEQILDRYKPENVMNKIMRDETKEPTTFTWYINEK